MDAFPDDTDHLEVSCDLGPLKDITSSPNSMLRESPAPKESVTNELPINDDSVLPPFNLQKDEDAVQDHDGPDEEEEEGRLLNAWTKWQEHRGSSRLRLSATPNDPEEDDDAVADRFVSGIVSK